MLFGTKDWTKFQKGFKIQVWAHAQTLTSPAQIIIVFNDKNPWSKKKIENQKSNQRLPIIIGGPAVHHTNENKRASFSREGAAASEAQIRIWC